MSSRKLKKFRGTLGGKHCPGVCCTGSVQVTHSGAFPPPRQCFSSPITTNKPTAGEEGGGDLKKPFQEINLVILTTEQLAL